MTPRATGVLQMLAGTAGGLALAAVLVAGFAGVQQPPENLAPTAVLMLFLVGGAFASALVGDLFRWLSP